jgi:hypothetical protein
MLVTAALAAIAVPTALAGRTDVDTLHATLSGKVEVPKGAPGGKGTATITLNEATGRVCWTFKVAGTDKPVAAHIHKGGPGKAGPVAVPFGKAYSAKGCTTAPKNVVEAIYKRPAAYYVNVHTAKYPAGAVRGQLSAM